MAAKERIEDIGRIAELLRQALNHDMWDIKDVFNRDKDFAELFMKLDKEKQHDKLHNLAYNMSSLRDILYDVQIIADGEEE
jgi:hypothetical protein